MYYSLGHFNNGIARKVANLLWKVRGCWGSLWLIAAAGRRLARTARCWTIRMLLQCSCPVHLMRLFLLTDASAAQVFRPTLIRMGLDNNIACLAKSSVPFSFLLHAWICRMFRWDGAFLFCDMENCYSICIFDISLSVWFSCFRSWLFTFAGFQIDFDFDDTQRNVF